MICDQKELFFFLDFFFFLVLFSILLHLAIVEIWELFHLLCPMKNLFPSESCKETQFNAFNPQSWLQVERGKLSKFSSQSSSSM